jgi:hypothetical protein
LGTELQSDGMCLLQQNMSTLKEGRPGQAFKGKNEETHVSCFETAILGHTD